MANNPPVMEESKRRAVSGRQAQEIGAEPPLFPMRHYVCCNKDCGSGSEGSEMTLPQAERRLSAIFN